MATRSEAGVTRVLLKLEGAVTKGDYYEAHQLYRTLYFRYLNQKKFDLLLDLLYRGAKLLLENEQYASGIDLSILLVDALVQSETKPNEEWIGRIADLFEKMSTTIPERDTYLTNAVKWSMNSNKRGHPLLHTNVAKIFWKEKKHSLAQKHFFRGNDGKAFATMLIYLQTQNGQECDVEMYLAQAVLQILCLHNINMAEETFKMYVQLHPALKGQFPPYTLPLLSFLWLLMNALRNDSVEQFRQLKVVYQERLQCDSNYSEYLDTIGRVWFKETPSNSSRHTNNMFSELLKNMVVDSSDDEDVSGTGGGQLAGEIPDLD